MMDRLRRFFTESVTLAEEDEETLPLTKLESFETESTIVIPLSPTPPRPSHLRNLIRILIIFLILLLSYNFLSYLYQDPSAWPPQSRWPSTTLTPIVIRTSQAKYRGIRNLNEDFVSFHSIPYAQAPLGDLRFRSPRELLENQGSEDIVNATIPNQGCPRSNPFRADSFWGTEDCLTVSVTTPRRRIADSKLPVVVWLHGGGFYSGAAVEGQYDPKQLITRSILMNKPFIFVAVNYRLGTLGFSASPPKPGPPPFPPHIPTQAPEDMDLNVGFKDQIMALQWVQKEIENFGGDKTQVTLFGHSAGAISIGLHQLYSPRNLFRGAFMLSGAPTSFPVPWPHDAAARTLHALPGPSRCPAPVGQIGGPPSNKLLLECLRSLPIEHLMSASQIALLDYAPQNGYFPFYPVMEGEFNGSWLHTRPSDMIVRGDYAKIPVVLGNVVDEGTAFTNDDIESKDDVADIIRGMFTFTYGAIETILTPIWDYYPDDPTVGSPYQTGEELFDLNKSYKRAASVIGDFFFQAPRRHFLRETPKDFGEPSWSYIYDEPRIGYDARYGVSHAADLGMWFHHPASNKDLKQLSRHMASYLINFVSNLDPNGPGLNVWPQYGTERRILHFAKHSIAVKFDNFRLEAMKFINTNNPIFMR